MLFITFGLDDYGLTVFGFFMLVVPACFYILGLSEDRKKAHRYFIVGLILHALSILHRGLLLGALPLSDKRDNISLMAFAMALIFLYIRRKDELKESAISVLPLICLTMFIAMAHRTMDSVTPFMDTPWFYLHAFFYFVSFSFFGVAACLGGHYIWAGSASNTPLFEHAQYKLISLGWILLSVGLFAGSVWFYMAYGTYWLWTSKELWISITWLYVGLYLHARLIKGFTGRPVAVLGIICFIVAMFTYFGVGTVIPSPPTQF